MIRLQEADWHRNPGLFQGLRYRAVWAPPQETHALWYRWPTFLRDRTQCIVVDGISSTSTSVDSGVPQGTVLGPLLFLLYINNLPQNVTSQVRLLADDCLLNQSVKCTQDQLDLQRDLTSLHEWSLKWGMNFNPSKCVILSMSRSESKLTKFYTLDGVILEHVQAGGQVPRRHTQWRPQMGEAHPVHHSKG